MNIEAGSYVSSEFINLLLAINASYSTKINRNLRKQSNLDKYTASTITSDNVMMLNERFKYVKHGQDYVSAVRQRFEYFQPGFVRVNVLVFILVVSCAKFYA